MLPVLVWEVPNTEMYTAENILTLLMVGIGCCKGHSPHHPEEHAQED